MMRIWMALIAGAVCTTVLFGESGTAQTTKTNDTARWKTYTSKEGRFTVDMPGEPKVKGNSVTLSMNPNKSLSDGDAVFCVAYLDLREDTPLKGASDDETLDKAIDMVANKMMKGEIKSEKRLELDKHPGREVQILRKTMTDGTTVVNNLDLNYNMIIIISQNRLYTVYRACSQSKDSTPEDGRKFLASFKILE
jgi:hypothetical protein